MTGVMLLLYKPIRISDVLNDSLKYNNSRIRFANEYGRLESDGFIPINLHNEIESIFLKNYQKYTDIVNPLLPKLNSEFDSTNLPIANYDQWMADRLLYILDRFNTNDNQYIKRYFITTQCGLAAELFNGTKITFNWYPIDSLCKEPNKYSLYTSVVDTSLSIDI